MIKYIDATPESGKKFYMNFHQKGKVIMLNLLKYKSKADYSNFESLRPGYEVTGKEAYELYMKYTLPKLDKAGMQYF